MESVLYWIGALFVAKALVSVAVAALANIYAFFLRKPNLRKYGPWAGLTWILRGS